MLPNGVYTALVTPFDAEKNINLHSLRHLIRFQIQQGITGLVLLGTTGEAPTLSREEQDLIIKTAAEETKGKVPLIIGTGAYSTAVTVQNTLRAQELGADIALIVTPYYNKPTSEGIYQHFKEIAKACTLPVIVYNIQSRTARNIDTPTLKRIAELSNVIAVKESSGSIEQMTDVIDCIIRERPGFKIFSGDDILTYPLIALGGHGVISVVSNLIPGKVVNMVEAALRGDFRQARDIHYELLPIFKGAFIETNPIPIKEAMNVCGHDVGGYRLPLCDMLPDNKHALRKILEHMQLTTPVNV